MIIAATTTMLLTSPMSVLAQDNSILEDSYIITQEFVEAEVMRIKKSERVLVVKGANQGKIREFYVPDGAVITIKGKDAKFKDIRRGDQLMVSMVPMQTKVQVARIAIPSTDMSLEDREANPVDEALPAVLPQTASAWYAILGLGIVAMFAGTFMRKARK